MLTQPAQVLPAQRGYVQFTLGAGDTAQVHYRLRERSAAHYKVGVAERTVSCTGHWRGETLLRVEPAGEYLLPVEPSPAAGKLIDSI
jgi:hypothetical protein